MLLQKAQVLRAPANRYATKSIEECGGRSLLGQDGIVLRTCTGAKCILKGAKKERAFKRTRCCGVFTLLKPANQLRRLSF